MLNIFFYFGYAQNGELKFGFEKGGNKEKIKLALKERKIFIKKIVKLPFNKKQKADDIIMFFAQTKMFIKNGYPFPKILNILEENPNLKIYTENMRQSLEKGKSLYEILKNSGIELRNTELIIIKSGEESGNIYRAFEIIENNIKRRESIKKEITKIMIYPIMVLIMAGFLTLFMGLYILPDFIKIIENSSQNMPLITRIIVGFTNKFSLIFLSFLIFGASLIHFFKKEKNRENLFQILIKINIFKRITDKIFIADFTYALGILLSSGVTIIEAINLIKNEIKYSYFRVKLENAENNLRKGRTIYFSFKEIEIFSKIDLELIKAGEESGELVDTLHMTALKNRDELKRKIDIGIKFIEPITIIIIGIIVGSIFLGMYLPIFQMLDNI